MPDDPNPPAPPTPPPAEPAPEQKPQTPGNALPAAPVGPVPYASPEPIADPADVEKNKVFALLSYVGILWLVPLLAAKDSPFARFHCNQGILLSCIACGAGVIVMVLWFVGWFIPFVGPCVTCILWLCYFGFTLTYSIMGIVNAANGRMKRLPGFPAMELVK